MQFTRLVWSTLPALVLGVLVVAATGAVATAHTSSSGPSRHPDRSMWAVVESREVVRSDGHVVSVAPTRPGPGPAEIAVTFDRRVTRCAFTATPGSANGVLNAGVMISATGAVGVPQVPEWKQSRTVLVVMTTPQFDVVETGFHLVVTC